MALSVPCCGRCKFLGMAFSIVFPSFARCISSLIFFVIGGSLLFVGVVVSLALTSCFFQVPLFWVRFSILSMIGAALLLLFFRQGVCSVPLLHIFAVIPRH